MRRGRRFQTSRVVMIGKRDDMIRCFNLMEGRKFAIISRRSGQWVSMSVWFLTEEGKDALKGGRA